MDQNEVLTHQIKSGPVRYILFLHPLSQPRTSLCLPGDPAPGRKWMMSLTDGRKLWCLPIKEKDTAALSRIRQSVRSAQLTIRHNPEDNQMTLTLPENENFNLPPCNEDEMRKNELTQLMFHLMDTLETETSRKRPVQEYNRTELNVDSLVSAPVKQAKTRSLKPPPSRSRVNPSLKKTATKRGVDFD